MAAATDLIIDEDAVAVTSLNNYFAKNITGKPK